MHDSGPQNVPRLQQRPECRLLRLLLVRQSASGKCNGVAVHDNSLDFSSYCGGLVLYYLRVQPDSLRQINGPDDERNDQKTLIARVGQVFRRNSHAFQEIL